MMGFVSNLFQEGASDLVEDAYRLLREIEPDAPGPVSAAADCRPPLDVIETATSVEVIMDVPGVPPSALRVAIRHDSLLVVGAKPGGAFEPRARYHLAERASGRFTRVVRLSGVFDGRRARATLDRGQLRVVLPLLDERRGRLVPIPVERA